MATESQTETETATPGTDPIRWDNVEEDTLGTHTYEGALYDAEEFDARRPSYYRSGRTAGGNEPRFPKPAAPQTVWETEAVVDFTEACNRNKAPQDGEEVAVTPTAEEMAEFKEEYDTGHRNYEPHFLRVSFFNERIVGNKGLSAAYGLVIGNARHAENPDYRYEWEADYETGTVTILIQRENPAVHGGRESRKLR